MSGMDSLLGAATASSDNSLKSVLSELGRINGLIRAKETLPKEETDIWMEEDGFKDIMALLAKWLKYRDQTKLNCQQLEFFDTLRAINKSIDNKNIKSIYDFSVDVGVIKSCLHLINPNDTSWNKIEWEVRNAVEFMQKYGSFERFGRKYVIG